MPRPEPVVVVGGGPGGSATAISLARRGHAVTVLDRARFPRDKACSEYGSPSTVRELARLGVLPAVEAQGATALTGTRVVAAAGSALLGRFAKAGGRPWRPTGLALPRRELDAALLSRARAEGATVLEGARCVGVARQGGTMRVTYEDAGRRREICARLVVGADGLRSRVARSVTGVRRGRLARLAFVAHVEGVRGLDTDAEMHVGAGAYVGLNPLGGGVTNVALVVRHDEATSAAGDPARFVAERLAGFPGLADRVDPSRLVREWLVTGPFDAVARRSTADGTLLVGDAADFFDPFTGEGIWSALIGARMAARTLDGALAQEGPVTEAMLAPYRAARRRRFLGKWMVERMIGYAMLHPRLFDRCVGRLQRRGMADTLIGVTGDFVPAWRVLNPAFLGRMVA